MDINDMWTFSGSQEYLQSSSSDENILMSIKETVYSWNYGSQTEIDCIKKDINDIVEDVLTLKFKEEERENVRECVRCVVHNEISENLMPLIRGKFANEDLYLYQKCTDLCKKNISAGHFGLSVYSTLQFFGGVVELSVIDTYKCPQEKINCLCLTYDQIFAELKFAMATIISKYSEKECDIPIINNEDVLPIVMLVIVKSKLLYLWSNLFYIKYFAGEILEKDSHIRSVFQMFETAVNKIMILEESSLNTGCPEIRRNMDITNAMTLISDQEDGELERECPLIEFGKKRLTFLIKTSTAERNFIPLKVEKIFS